MKRLIDLCVTCLLLAVFTSSFAYFRLTEKVYDFGEVSDTTKVLSHDFVLVNMSEDSLAVNRVVASCLCLSSFFEKIPVGKEDSVTITMNLKTNTLEGDFEKIFQIKDSEGNSYNAKLLGTIIKTQTENE